MANEVTVWNKVMSSALAIPGVQVDRETFLRSELRQYCSKDELEKAISNPVDVLSEDRIDSLANSCINNHLLKVTSLSVVAGIPGGLAMAPDFDKMCTYKITYPNFQAFSKNNLCKWVTQRLFFVSLHHVCT